MEGIAMPAKSRDGWAWCYLNGTLDLSVEESKADVVNLDSTEEFGGKPIAVTVLPRSQRDREQAELRRLRGLCEKLVLTRDAHVQWGPILKAIDAIAAELERAGGK